MLPRTPLARMAVDRVPGVANRILLIEDDPDVARLIRMLAEDEHWHVDVARNADEARRAWRAARPDLMVIDLHLPGEADGVDVFQQARSELRAVPSVLLSAAAEAPQTARALEIELIRKPFELEDVVSTFRRYLGEP